MWPPSWAVFSRAAIRATTPRSPIRFGGGGGGPGGFFARLAAANGAAATTARDDRIKKATQVTAVADSRIQSVIVTAPKDLMDQIAGMMHDLDVPSQRDQNVYVYHLRPRRSEAGGAGVAKYLWQQQRRAVQHQLADKARCETRCECQRATSAANTTSSLGSQRHRYTAVAAACGPGSSLNQETLLT